MPWIPKAVWTQHAAERERLLALVERLTDHTMRVERVGAGLSETPAAPRTLLPPMPDAVRRWVDSHERGPVRDRIRKEALTAAKVTGSWDPVVQQITHAEGEP